MADPLERYRPASDALARSVLDRLLDADPDFATERLRPVGEQAAELREGLRRDIEALLNTRCAPATPPRELPELADSLLAYGVEGYFLTSLVTDAQRAAFAKSIERRIRLFEPRLDDVAVAVMPNPNPSERALRLRISAVYVMQPGMPPITFETAIDPTTQRISVEGSRG